MAGTESLTLTDPNPAVWTVTFDGSPQPVTNVTQGIGAVLLDVGGGAPTTILLSYIGGAYVVGDSSGLPLQPVSDFPVGIV